MTEPQPPFTKTRNGVDPGERGAQPKAGPQPGEAAVSPERGRLGTRALLRLAAAAAIVIGGALAVVLLSVFPVRLRGVRLSAWCFSWGVRLLMPALGLRFRCDEPRRIVEHRGLIFPNHISFFDTLVMSYLLPMRFLAKAEVRRWPFIGWIATATGSMYVNRDDKAARLEARKTVALAVQADPYPPLVVYPEGTTNPTESLLPFRYGVFEIAVTAQIPYLLCAIVYERPEVVTWHSREEGLMTTVLRLVQAHSHSGFDTSQVRLIPVTVIHPQPGDDPQELADDAREIIGAALSHATSHRFPD